MEKHFLCTACGKCCRGWVPLTIDDALRHAHRFPLAMVWTPVRPGAKSYAWLSRLCVTIELRPKKPVAVRIAPTAYIPPSVECPALAPDGLCLIHEDKPARCRAMPFSPYHDESDQDGLLVPKPGWACDTSPAAPIVYRDGRILARDDYERELKAIRDDAPTLRSYAEWMYANMPTVAERLARMAAKPAGGHVVLDFTTLLARLPKVDIVDFAARQLPVLEDFMSRTSATPALSEYHTQYRNAARTLERVLKLRTAT
jgi:Fe-S-cluster containining protein